MKKSSEIYVVPITLIGGENSRASITQWLNELGARDLQDYQVEHVGYVTRAGAAGVIDRVNRSGNFREHYASSLPMTHSGSLFTYPIHLI